MNERMEKAAKERLAALERLRPFIERARMRSRDENMALIRGTSAERMVEVLNLASLEVAQVVGQIEFLQSENEKDVT